MQMRDLKFIHPLNRFRKVNVNKVQEFGIIHRSSRHVCVLKELKNRIEAERNTCIFLMITVLGWN